MFSQINGLPLHALVVHAAVVFVPLAALLGVLFAIPRCRDWSRIPLLLVSLIAAGTVFVSRQSGASFKSVLEANGTLSSQNPATSLVTQHESRGKLLFLMMLGYAVIAIGAFLLSRDAARFTGSIATVTSAVLVVGAAVVGFQTYRVGEIGAKAVWNPTGQVNYGSAADGESEPESEGSG